MIVKNEAAGNDSLSTGNTSLLNSASVNSNSSPKPNNTPVSPAVDGQTASVASSTTDCVVHATSSLSVGLMPTSFVSAVPKTTDSAEPLRLVVAANSLRSLVPKMSTHVDLPASGLSQPTLIVGPAVSAPSCIASPRRTVTVLPAGVRSPSQGPLAVINARPVAPAGQTVNFATRSPGKVTVLSLPKTSSVPGQFITVVPSTACTTAASTSGVTNKTTALPYKVVIRPSSAVSLCFACTGWPQNSEATLIADMFKEACQFY